MLTDSGSPAQATWLWPRPSEKAQLRAAGVTSQCGEGHDGRNKMGNSATHLLDHRLRQGLTHNGTDGISVEGSEGSWKVKHQMKMVEGEEREEGQVRCAGLSARRSSVLWVPR